MSAGGRPTAAADPLAVRLALSGLAASVAESATFPLDFVKTRMQLQGQSPGSSRRGAWATGLHAVRSEGVGACTGRGLAPAVARHLPYTGIRVVAYEQMRAWAAAAAQLSPGAPLPLPVNLLLGLTAGALGQAAAVPADLVKVRMQADGRLLAAGLQAQPRYRGLAHALATIARQEGWAEGGAVPPPSSGRPL